MTTDNYQEILGEIARDLVEIEDPGQIASYIPKLGAVNPNKLGMHLTTLDN